MEQFLKDITSTSWWIGVVVVGIIINLISSYLKPFLDERMSKFSAEKKEALEKSQKQHTLLVESLKKDQRLYLAYAFKDVRLSNGAVGLICLSIFIFLFSAQISASPLMNIFALWLSYPGLPITSKGLSGIVQICTMLVAAIMMIQGLNQLERARKITQALNEAVPVQDTASDDDQK